MLKRSKLSAVLLAVLVAVTAFAGRSSQSPSGTPDPNKLWAFVVGVSNYTHVEPLRYGATDALGFADFLASPRGGGIPPDHIYMLLEDQATKYGIDVALTEFVPKVKEGDTVYVYLAGHGTIQQNLGYFIPIDGNDVLPRNTAISFRDLKDAVELSLVDAKVRVLVTDICNSGRIGPQTSELALKIQNVINEYFQKLRGETGIFLNLLATRSNEYSYEYDDLEGGVFTTTLLNALNGKAAPGEPVLTAGKLYDYVFNEVANVTRNKQHPMVNPDYDKSLPLSFPDRPGPPPRITNLTTLALSNVSRTPYVRVEWMDARTQTRAVRPLPKDTETIPLGALPLGDVELKFYDGENKDHSFRVKLQSGQNKFDVSSMELVENAPVQIASLSPVGFAAPFQAVQDDTASVALRVDAGASLLVDNTLWGTSDGNPIELRGLTPGVHTLNLVLTADHEQRFRLRLFRGSHRFDPTTGELQYVSAIGTAPTQEPLPAGLPVVAENDYRAFLLALWEDRLIPPAANPAVDAYTRMQPLLPAALNTQIRNRLIVAMGNRAQKIILKYVRGGDIRWNAATFDEGEQLIIRIRQLFKTTPDFQSDQSFFQGRAAIARAQYVQGETQLRQSIALQPEASHSHNAIGLSLWQQNRYTEAIPELQQAMTISPQWNYPRYTLALTYLEQRRYNESEQTFQSALQNDGEDSTAHHGLGQLYSLLFRFDEAEAQLQQAVLFNPGNAYAYHTYAKLAQKRNRNAEAEQMYRLAIRLEPDEPIFQASLADFLRVAGRIQEAQALFARVANVATDNSQILAPYVAFLNSQNRSAEARTLFDQAIRKSARDANLRVIYGQFLKSQGRAADAKRQYEEGLKIDSSNPYAHFELAALALDEKKLNDAEKELQLAIKADSQLGAPHQVLAQIRVNQKRYAEALDEYRKALQFTIDLPEKQKIEGLIAEAEKAGVDDAINQAKRLIDQKKYAEAWLRYGDILKSAPDSTAIRDAILTLQFEHSDAIDPSKLPTTPLTATLLTDFWKQQVRADSDWRVGRKEQSAQSVLTAIETLKSPDRQLLMSAAFNIGNDARGIHEAIYRWAGRLLELRKWDDAIRLMDASIQHNIFDKAPGVTALTIDSLMWPTDVADPKRFEDFDVLHHQDRRAHEIYATAYAAQDNWAKAQTYVEAFKSNPEELSRLTAAMLKWLPPGTVLKIQ